MPDKDLEKESEKTTGLLRNRIQLSLSDAQVSRSTKVIQRKGIPLQEMLRRAIDDYLDKEEEKERSRQ